jgi:hypothetical protein
MYESYMEIYDTIKSIFPNNYVRDGGNELKIAEKWDEIIKEPFPNEYDLLKYSWGSQPDFYDIHIKPLKNNIKNGLVNIIIAIDHCNLTSNLLLETISNTNNNYHSNITKIEKIGRHTCITVTIRKI